jgi:uncharacterized protein YndB with AHSA1/START domain
MSKGIVVHATTAIEAPVDTVWDALVNPRLIKQYFFGTDVVRVEGGQPDPLEGRMAGEALRRRRRHPAAEAWPSSSVHALQPVVRTA